MSDFFGDDFTAELRGYFLDSMIKETERFIDLVDPEKWQKLVSEILEQNAAWIVDARTNEFEFLAQWFEELQKRSQMFQSSADLANALELLKSYLEALNLEKKDAAEYLQKFSIEAKVVGQAQFLHCRIQGTNFGIPVSWVVEVIEKVSVQALPSTKMGLAGVISFRGEAIPVMNLQDFGFQSQQDQEKSYFVICNVNNSILALRVSEADQLLTLDNSEMQSAEAAEFMVAAPYITKFFTRENQNVMVLDLELMVA